MRLLRVHITRRSDGGGTLVLERADGSRTWQRQTDRHAAFFAAHDLTHLAVESVLRLRGAFYGLVASGWEFDDFLPPYPRGALPTEALWVELLVGLLDAERASEAAGAARSSAQDMAEMLATAWPSSAGPQPHALDEATLVAVRDARDSHLQRWAAVGVGDMLELEFAP
ncbi:MAG: hypothetical protein KF709_10655 [Gemmatimonadaceae bacterium]|nr:hypothetical protein [Gemmatimonadaceae bacterium]